MKGQGWKELRQFVKNEAQDLDQIIALWREEFVAAGKRIFCAAGCSSCCTLFVQATLAEALIVAEELDAGQLTRLEAYVVRQRECLAGEDDFLTVLRKQRTIIGPCPFLDPGGHCSIYAQRPLACRALLSTKHSEWCSVDFHSLDPLEKRLYLESLDRSVVAFPVHYVARTQKAAQDAELRILEKMRDLPGNAAISGNFPLLVYLACTHNLESKIKEGRLNWQRELHEDIFSHPLLLDFNPKRSE